jgi:hypothetical protein
MLGAIRRGVFGLLDPSSPLVPVYLPLRRGRRGVRGEIRMLTLLKPKHLLCCTLESVWLDDPGIFTALSYCWGDSSRKKTILVNGTEVKVTENLHDALEELVSMNVVRVWIDAICINQADLEERSHQVQHMKFIYSAATEVISWIGNASHDSREALELLRSPTLHGVASRTWEIDTVSLEDRRQHWAMLDNLFDRPYWRRIWIIQEVAVAAKVRVICGEDEISWDELATANTVYERWRPAELASKHRGGNYSYVQNITIFRQQIALEEPISLLLAMSKTQKALSTDPRDKIFALLGLCCDGSTLVPSPNYVQSVDDVLRDMTRKMMRTFRSLDIMFAGSSQIDSHSSQRSRPSWAPDLLSRNALNAFDSKNDEPSPLTSEIKGFLLTDGMFRNDILRIQGLVYGTVGYCSRELNNNVIANHFDSQLGQAGDYYSGISEFRDAVSECLFGKEGQHESSADMNQIEARRRLLDLVLGRNKAGLLDLRHFIHDFHVGSHNPMCGLLDELDISRTEFGSHFERFLCHHPDYEADYESTLLTTTRKFLGEASRVIENARIINNWRNPNLFQKVKAGLTNKLKSESQRQIQYTEHRVFARYFLSAALEKRQLIILQTGQVGRASGFTRPGDKICRIRGCSRPVVLREEGAIQGNAKYRLVSDATLSFSKKDVSNYSIFVEKGREHWWERADLKESIETFEVS